MCNGTFVITVKSSAQGLGKHMRLILVLQIGILETTKTKMVVLGSHILQLHSEL